MNNHNKLLINKAKEGDNASKEKLISYYHPFIHSTVNRFVSQYRLDENKDDILQDAKLLFLEFINLYNPDLSNFGFFLKQNFEKSLKNKYGKQYIQLSSNTKINDDLISEDIFNRICLLNDLFKAVDSLPIKQKLAVKLYYLEELSQSDSAAYMNMKQSAFSQLLSRAIETLRKKLI